MSLPTSSRKDTEQKNIRDLARWLIIVPLVILVLFSCGILATFGLGFPSPGEDYDVRSNMRADYSIWDYIVVHPVSAAILDELITNMENPPEQLVVSGSFWPGPTSPPKPTPVTPTGTGTNTPTATATIKPPRTPTNSATITGIATSTVSPTSTNRPPVRYYPTSTSAHTPDPTLTNTSTPTATSRTSATPSPTQTASSTPTSAFITRTPTLSPLPSLTMTATLTPQPTITPSPTPTNTPTVTHTPNPTGLKTPYHSSTPNYTPTLTNTPVPTDTPTNTPTSTLTSTPTPTETPTVTPTCALPLPIDGDLPDGYVQRTYPDNGEIDVPINRNTIFIFYNQPMKNDGGGGSVERPEHYRLRNRSNNNGITILNIFYDPVTWILTIVFDNSDPDWEYSTQYEISIQSSVMNMCGNPQGGTVRTTFTTENP